MHQDLPERLRLAQAKLEDSELQVKELSRQVMALERAKVELEARNRQLESAARGGKDSPGSLPAPSTPSQVRRFWELAWRNIVLSPPTGMENRPECSLCLSLNIP